MQQARIYSQSKSAGQSVHAGTGQWILEMERTPTQKPEPLMGWTQSNDTLNQIEMSFDTQKSAELFAKSQGWLYTISNNHERTVQPRNYSDSFICDMVKE